MTDTIQDNLVQLAIEGVKGFRVAGVYAGLKKTEALDFALIASDVPSVAAGVFTTNQVKAAPVLVDMERLAQTQSSYRAVAINTGCANACTGQPGIDDAREMARLTAQKLGCAPEEVLVLSTGVIGTQLPMEKIQRGIDLASASLGQDWEATARAIMTTDTRPKQASITVTKADGTRYTIAGISKGAGMIAPNMATMLSVVVTDAALTPEQTSTTLKIAAEGSYNRIVVDGDMSTNDTVLLLANGQSGAQVNTSDDQKQFQKALNAVCLQLAKAVVRDGEGVTKFISINVHGAPDNETARKIANTIATSALVKTAFYGNDANWGRIIAAAGRSGVALDPSKLSLWLYPQEEMSDLSNDGLLLVSQGTPTHYSEERATAIVSSPNVLILLMCGMGDGWATVWTCDLSHDYVSINGSYRS
ncbi:MAG: bifunctional glutamate N-acetyltransferase/amino-acid acetyltransferase ArgJ [bacterium]|nr:bifunctional glutamate N-acetyltransferase/amino-acid acetyltransferase ArgJ [bacterium]